MRLSRVWLLAVVVLVGCGGGETKTAPFDKSVESVADEPILGAATGNFDETGRWGSVIPWPHVPVSMANLPDGRILTYSGSERRTWPTTEQTYSATWDPQTGQMVENFFSGHNMFCAALSLTSDGRVLVNGGRNSANSPWTSLFDYRDGDWEAVQNMASGGRWYPSTLSLGDGSVMTAMGTATNVRNPDLWKPDSGWRVLNGLDFVSMRRGRGGSTWFPQLSVAPNGNVFHYWDTSRNQMLNSQGSGSARAANATTDGGEHPTGVQLMYDAGKLLVTGSNDGSWRGNPSRQAFTIDLNGPAPDIRAVPDMAHRRKFHQLIPLPTGEVLVIGGNTSGVKFRDSGSVMEPEIWNPQTGQWRGMANMAVPRDYHSTALLLTDGRVVAAGGGYDANNPNSSGTHQDGQIFSPPYLFSGNNRAVRPTVTAAQASLDTGEWLDVTTRGNVQGFSFIKMGATTHAVNTDSRFYRPLFESTGDNTYRVKVHENPNIAIPGYWMLFALDDQNVPSVAQVIRVTSLDTRLDNLAPSGSASQSSTYGGLESLAAGNAIDGDLSGSFESGSLAHTKENANAWWEVDLGRVYEIDTIRIWNRSDCCAGRLADFHVLVSSEPMPSTDLSTTLAQNGVRDIAVQGVAGRQTDLPVQQSGRYVRVQLEGRNFLQLAEVQIFGSAQKNVEYEYVEGTWNVLPDFDALTPVATGKLETFSIEPALRSDYFGFRQRAVLLVPETGNYTFSTTSSDGSQLFIDGQMVVNNDGRHGSRRRQGTVALTAGEHPIMVTFFQAGGFASLQVGWSGPGFSERALDNDLVSADPVPLEIAPLAGSPQPQGDEASFFAAAIGRAPLRYSWNFGDGNPDTPFTSEPGINHSFSEPGRYVVSVTVRDGNGDEVRQTFTQIVHAPLIAESSSASGSLLELSARRQLWNVNPDNNSVTVTDTGTLSVLAEIDTGTQPVSLAMGPDNRVWVVNRESATISVIDPGSLSVVGGHSLARASQPYGIVADDDFVYIALEATGQIVKLASDGSQAAVQQVGSSPRNLALDAATGNLYVSRFVTPPLPDEDTAHPIVDDGVTPFGGEVLVVNSADLAVQDTIVMEHIDRVPSENQGPGMPNYLGAVAISPSGGTAWLPSKQDNILGGGIRAGAELSFDQTVRAITSRIDLTNNIETTEQRVDHDNSSVAHSADFDPFGATLFVSLEGNRQVALIDTSTAIEIGRFDTGHAPQGLLVSDDGSRLYVHNFMDRSVGVYDITDVVNEGATSVIETATVNTVSNELLDPIVLRGKQLFYDARDDRLAGLDYMSCASCHDDGEHDGRVWDFTGLGEGLRNTITLRGRAGTGHGMLHWTGNFDEGQDFEEQIRAFAGGTGLMDDADFALSADPLGEPKAGRSEDLDALAAYMESLTVVPPSPWRNADGSFSDDAQAGQLLFVTSGCVSCHDGEIFTDSNTAALHDIGTIMPDSGNRLSEELTGLDTPTLLGVWRTGPYLHDGSTVTLQEAISAHLDVSFSDAELDQLEAYLAQLDDSSNVVIDPPPEEPPQNSDVTSNPVANGAITLDGSLREWAALEGFANDPADADSNNPIDWISAAIAHDNNNFYLSYRTDTTITDSWGYGVYIDTDGDRNTGFRGFDDELPIGADYLLESASLLSYTGSGINWSWSFIGSAQRAANGNNAEYAIVRSQLDNAQSLKLFLRGDNAARGGTVVDFYPDAANDPQAGQVTRYLSYTVASDEVNTVPVASDQALSVAANSNVSFVLDADDADGDPLGYALADQPVNGSLTGTAPNLTYTPDTDFAGADSFTFTASDAQENSNLATVTITVQGQPLNNNGSITVDGDLVDWADRDSFGLDPSDASGLNDGIDWQRGWMAHDANNAYLAFRNHDPVVESWGFSVYLDTDSNRATGFTGFADEYPIGAEILIQGSFYYQYTGSGANWNWQELGSLIYASAGDVAEMALPLQQLGNPSALQLFFLGENAALGGSTLDFYPDGVLDESSPVRFHSYTLDARGLNRAPVANGQSLRTEINTPIAVVLSGSDPENTSLSFEVTSQPGNGVLGGTVPNLAYTPNDGFSGSDSFAFRVNDGELDSAPVLISIGVQGNNQPEPTNDVSNPGTAIIIDGGLGDWASADGYLSDLQDVAEPDGLDWQQVWMSNGDNNFYLATQSQQPVGELVWGHQVFFDTDTQSGTGFTGFEAEYVIGADYLIEGEDLFSYTGSGTDWSWSFVATLQTSVADRVAEYQIPRALWNTQALEFVMLADSAAVEGVALDLYPDAISDPAQDDTVRRFGYTTGE